MMNFFRKTGTHYTVHLLTPPRLYDNLRTRGHPYQMAE